MSNVRFSAGVRAAVLALAFAAACPLAIARGRAAAAECGLEASNADCAPILTHGSGAVEVAFSPGPAAVALVVKAIDSAREGGSIRLMAYNFTSPTVLKALLRARHARHVDVQLVVDHKSNVSEDHSGKSRAALGALVDAGASVRTVSAFSIAHDKAVVVDGRHVQTGSFNYTVAAEKSNSENVIVEWDNPQLAKRFLEHWQRNWDLGQAWRPAY